MKRSTFLVFSLIALLALFCLLTTFFWLTTTQAQTTTQRVAMWVVASGGGESQGSTYTINGSAGQSNASAPAQGSTYRVDGGFWWSESAPNLYLPIVAQQPTPIPTDTPIPTPTSTPPPGQPQWRRFGNPGLIASSLFIQNGDQLFAGARNGGLYKGGLNTCPSGGTLTRVFDHNVFDVVFQGSQGALADFDTTVYYSADGGNSWTPTTSNVQNPFAVEIAGGNAFYAGTESKGIYISTNGGVTWDPLNSQPQDINVLALNTNTLWVGTEGAGVFIVIAGSNQPTPRNNGLDGESLKVWDFVFDASNNVYIATFNGVYQSNISANQWQPSGLQGTKLLSLEIAQGYLYAGTSDAGVRRRPLNGGDWQEISSPGWDTTYTVRDLLYEPTYCQGLLAATEDGVWVYK